MLSLTTRAKSAVLLPLLAAGRWDESASWRTQRRQNHGGPKKCWRAVMGQVSWQDVRRSGYAAKVAYNGLVLLGRVAKPDAGAHRLAEDVACHTDLPALVRPLAFANTERIYPERNRLGLVPGVDKSEVDVFRNAHGLIVPLRGLVHFGRAPDVGERFRAGSVVKIDRAQATD